MRSLKYLLAALPLQLVGLSTAEKDVTIIVTTTRTLTVCPVTQLNLCEPDPTNAITEWPAYPTSISQTWEEWTSTSSPASSMPTTSIRHGSSSSSSSFVDGVSTSTSSHSSIPITSHSSLTTSTSSHSSILVNVSSSITTSHIFEDGTTATIHRTTTTSSSTSTITSTKPFDDETTTSYLSTLTSTSTTSSTELISTTLSSSLTTFTSSHSGSLVNGSSSITTTDGTTTTASETTTTSGVSTTTSTTTSSSVCTVSPISTLLPSVGCNTAGDRSQWCSGRSIDTNTHEFYSTGETKHFDLVITNTTLDFDGTPRMAFAINGQSPGPAIEVNWGDKVVISVTNLLQDNATTIHWHGIRQTGTNDQDGVPGVTECGIAPGNTKIYSWDATSYGTGWYHAHLLSQYGDGLRGPLIVHGPATANYDIDMGPVMIDDTFAAPIFQMAYRAAHFGRQNTTNYLLNGKNKSPDLTKGEHQKWTVKPGKKHLFRIINSSGQNAYAVHVDKHIMTVIGADFVPIVPYTTEWLNIGNGQRYDVIVEANKEVSSYFFRAVTQTLCPSICLNNGLGTANGIIEYEGAPCDFIPTTDLGNRTTASFATCADEPLSKLIPHIKKTGGDLSTFQSQVKTLPGGTGSTAQFSNQTIFRWSLNNSWMNINFTQPTLKTLATVPGSSDSLLLSNAITLNTAKDQWVYFVIQSSFPVSHPMHLHGHDFSILGQGTGVFGSDKLSTLNFDNPMRRDTTYLYGSGASPTGYTVIGFETDNPGAWIMHCHLIFHAEGGMALQFIERPTAFDAATYYDKAEFKDECAALTAYESEGAHRQKHDYESGLKRRSAIGDLHTHHRHADVVRRS